MEISNTHFDNLNYIDNKETLYVLSIILSMLFVFTFVQNRQKKIMRCVIRIIQFIVGLTLASASRKETNDCASSK